MAQAILLRGGAGGVTSDDVTASKAQVLQGYKTVTTDSNDEVVEGTIPKRGTWSTASEVVNASGESTVHVRFEEGYYNKDGQYKPTAKIPYAVLTNILGIDANKMLSNLTIAGTTGNIKMINTQDNNYRSNKSMAFGIDGWSDRNNPVFWIDFPHGNGYYHRANNHPHTCIDAVNLGTADANSVLQWQTATSVHGVKFAGAIQRWICTTGDVITALGGEGFAWDDSYAGRGRGIVMKIPNGYYIQGANWAFLSSPNLQPWNVRKDININGTIGTMVDYGAGGVPFNGATFDNRLISGVANKGFILNGIGRYLNLKNINYGYQGILDGGLKFINGYSGNTHVKTAPDIGCVFSNSVNLTPFRYIKIGFKFIEFRGDGTGAQPARIELEVGATPISGAGGEGYHNESNTVVRDIGGRSNFATYTMTSKRTNAGNQSDMSQQYLTLDVSASQGHHFVYIMLGNIVHEYSGGSVYAVVVVNYIEFIN